MILLATSNVVFAEDYQLPATVNNPVVMPVGADEFQNGVKMRLLKNQAPAPRLRRHKQQNRPLNYQVFHLQVVPPQLSMR